MKYITHFNEEVFRKKLEKALPYLEENGDEGVSLENIVPESAGQYIPFEFLDFFNAKDEYKEGIDDDIYFVVDRVMDEVNEELKTVLEETGISKDYPYLSILVRYFDGVSVVMYPIS